MPTWPKPIASFAPLFSNPATGITVPFAVDHSLDPTILDRDPTITSTSKPIYPTQAKRALGAKGLSIHVVIELEADKFLVAGIRTILKFGMHGENRAVEDTISFHTNVRRRKGREGKGKEEEGGSDKAALAPTAMNGAM